MSIRVTFATALLVICLVLPGCPAEHDDDDAPANIEGDEAGECDDGVDNDQDGFTDCDDEGCANATMCAGDDDVADDDSAGDDDDTTAIGCAPCGGTYIVANSSDLDVVAACEVMTGSLTISNAPWLTNLDLPCLVSVGLSVAISENDDLTTIYAPALVEIGGTLNIWYNDALTTLDGLSSLTTVGDSVNIAYNDCLSQTEAEAFAEGLAVGGYIDVDFNGDNYPCP
jgi:hypothetical protein